MAELQETEQQVIDTETLPAAQMGGEVVENQEEQMPEWQSVLLEFIQSDNIADTLDEETLAKIGDAISNGVKTDEDSSIEWMDGVNEGMKLAKLEHEEKSFPWEDASNIKFPLIANASMQFASRAYPEIVQGDKVVKVGVFGDDPNGVKADRAERVTDFMTWQILQQMPAWEEGMDKLLNVLPNVGTLLRKTFYDEINRVPNVLTLLPSDFVVNAHTRSLKEARRITHILYYYENDVVERQNAGLWRDVDLGEANYTGNPADYSYDTAGSQEGESGDDASMFCFYEQHCWIDLDDDGYEEPYVATIHKDTNKVMRIVARYSAEDIRINKQNGNLIKIDDQKYFTSYTFVPSQDGTFHGIGFGHMLYNINEAINSTLNQLIDAGTLANIQGGFKAKSARVAGEPSFQAGEWKSVDIAPELLSKAFFNLPTKEPSQVLFSLLGLLIDTGQSIAMVTEVLTGQMTSANASPTTTLAMIEQGLKVYSAIHKRIHRSLKCEFKHLMELNGKYLTAEMYIYVLDNKEIIEEARAAQEQGIPFNPATKDFNPDDYDISPVADPIMSTDMQRMAKANALMQFKDDPGFNGYLIRKNFAEAIKAPNVDQLVPDPADMGPPPPNPLLLDIQRETLKDKHTFELKMFEARYKANESLSKAIKNIAEAEAAEEGTQLGKYRLELEAISKELNNGGLDGRGIIEQGGLGGPEPRPALPEGFEAPGGLPPTV